MKKEIMWNSVFTRILLSPLLVIAISSQSFGQSSEYLEPGYYAVVGVFKYEQNAAKFASEMEARGEESQYAYYPPRGYFYVQIGKYDSFQKARIKVLQTRKSEDLDSTWVYKAMPFEIEGGEIIGGDVNMDAGVGLQYEMKMDTVNVTKVDPGSSSDVSGIQKEDKIISVDGDNVAGIELTEHEVADLLHGIEGSEVKIAVMRDGELKEYNLTRDSFNEAEETLGIKFEIRNDTVFVVQVDPDSPAGSEIQIGDKLIEVDGRQIAGVNIKKSQVEDTFQESENEQVKVKVMRDGQLQDYAISRDVLEDPQVYLGMDYTMRNDTLFITNVEEGGKADQLGIKKGDKLVEIGEELVAGQEKSYEEITEAISEAISEGNVVTIVRDGEIQEFTLAADLLLDPKAIMGMDYELRNDTLFIVRVDKGGKADEAGLKRGDRLIEIGDESVAGQAKSESDISRSLTKAVNEGVMVTVMRDGREHDFFVRPQGYDLTNSAGIGILFDIKQDTAFIKRVIAGSPSEKLGLLPGDKILKIGNEDVTGSQADSKDISEKLTGADGTTVDVTIQRHQEIKEYHITREIIMSGSHVDRMDAGKFSGIKGRIVEEDIKGKVLYFNRFRSVSYAEVKGQIEVVNSDKLQRFAYKNAHEVIGIPLSINRSGNISLISEIFGYKKIQHDFNLTDPFNERTEGFLTEEDTVLVVNFELERYTKGDLVTMYNVYFFKDAAIMRPESRYEVQQLLYMLRENPDYRISILGHTNGNNKGPIIEMEEGSTAYFSREGPTVEGFGSAKKLSQARADLIREYLISNGIDASRMEAIGHGGKKAIYEKFDNLAYKNVRVEIEILAD